ncbi:MAG: LysR family transcriptional regulator [Actinobacteria bacterium]|nr:LysR family transcriptional regulator [Actinomycetota bacterium]
MDFDLRQLRSFLAIAEEGHFGRAAHRLHVAQPALSRQIRRLEEGLGVDLFDRTSRPTRLTAAGSAFLEEAQLAVYHAARAGDRSRRAARGEFGHLSVAGTFWAHNALIPAVVRAFHARAPAVRVELSTAPPTVEVESLRAERLDVCFGAFAQWVIGRRALEAEPLLEEEMVAIVAADHPFARRSDISLEDLASERFATLSHAIAPGLIGQQMTIFQEQGLFPTEVRELPDPWALLSLVAAGRAVGLHMASFSNLSPRGLVFVPIAPIAPTATLFLLWRRDDDREIVHAFLETAREVARSLEPPEVFRERATKTG